MEYGLVLLSHGTFICGYSNPVVACFPGNRATNKSCQGIHGDEFNCHRSSLLFDGDSVAVGYLRYMRNRLASYKLIWRFIAKHFKKRIGYLSLAGRIRILWLYFSPVYLPTASRPGFRPVQRPWGVTNSRFGRAGRKRQGLGIKRPAGRSCGVSWDAGCYGFLGVVRYPPDRLNRLDGDSGGRVFHGSAKYGISCLWPVSVAYQSSSRSSFSRSRGS